MVTVVLWAVARPFRRLVSMVSLTREQFGGIVPGAGTGPMSRVWQRLRGAPAEDRQSRWWDERRGAAAGGGHYPHGDRPEAEPVIRVPAQASRQRARTDVVPQRVAEIVPAARRPALPAGPDGASAEAGRPGRNEPDIDERVIYRRPDAVPLRPGGARPVQAEIVDGVPVYRIYRPRPTQAVYTPRGGPSGAR
ncbi:hypothetical protein BJF78_29020 [Pseudonocardia sp. CNS-139]|nr:hypothetical protein BJF78_29020 [Pseudonocardia sp. CNS-139]